MVMMGNRILERKEVNGFCEYIDFVRSWFGKNWTYDPLSREHLKEIHGMPESYPAVVWVEEIEADDWGPRHIRVIKFIDKENVNIERCVE
jgi:hypothetical protein